jgi:hypothetical protein
MDLASRAEVVEDSPPTPLLLEKKVMVLLSGSLDQT